MPSVHRVGSSGEGLLSGQQVGRTVSLYGNPVVSKIGDQLGQGSGPVKSPGTAGQAPGDKAGPESALRQAGD